LAFYISFQQVKNATYTDIFTLSGVFSALLAFITMALLGLGLSDSTEDTMPSLVQALLFGCLFSIFNLFTLRLSKWLYS